MTTEESWSFMKTIEAGYILGPLFIVYLLVVLLKLKKQSRNYSMFQYITLISLGIYILSVVALTTFPIEINLGMYKNQSPWYSRINPIPILTIDMATFILNIIMLVPFGVYQWLVVKQNKLSWELVAVRSFLFSLTIEVLQLLLYITLNSGRSVDINDLIANTLGGILGYYAIRFVSKNTYFKDLIDQFKVSLKSLIITN
ncbi:hypothetical protein CF394_11425 [Tetzosporium hominis]|uniref:VanZ-like domain-containing protein n=1 Tax=Tetzosporium hominis TaxID=2020506 RepID=A0A264W1H7_9BACL|nr:VanZ family protein [Tetzosporium hominis]OZS77423.1 hypothetical protein CF394_11425 [Tetzosporium hominis]